MMDGKGDILIPVGNILVGKVTMWGTIPCERPGSGKERKNGRFLINMWVIK
jgi:hypothetical protein